MNNKPHGTKQQSYLFKLRVRISRLKEIVNKKKEKLKKKKRKKKLIFCENFLIKKYNTLLECNKKGKNVLPAK